MELYATVFTQNAFGMFLIFTVAISVTNGRLNFLNHNTHAELNNPTTTPPPPTTISPPARDITIGPCIWAIDRKCPDDDIKFYLYTRRNMMDRQSLHVDETIEKSNLTNSYFNPKHPTKIIIHGYNSDMFLNPLHIMREEYLAVDEYNIIYVDWSALSPGPCYISAVHNTRHTGACVAQLVERILDLGSADMHVIGFSLGAQVPNYIARNLGSFLLPRITGLDPAMPLFITASDSEKLDASDAAFVDVLHTNALVQGKLERCGHVDFYMNGGIMQPGCNKLGSNPVACSHQRAPAYFLESIRSQKGFWGWACSSYIAYLLGMCPPTNYLLEAGEHTRSSTRGMFLISTNDSVPYALGKWTDLPSLGARLPTIAPTLTLRPSTHANDPLIRQVDEWGKLISNFNNLELAQPTPYSQDPNGENWTYFTRNGPSEITNDLKDNSGDEQNMEAERRRTVGGVHFTRKAQATTERQYGVAWSEYRKNLSEGIIDNNVFRLPQIKQR